MNLNLLQLLLLFTLYSLTSATTYSSIFNFYSDDSSKTVNEGTSGYDLQNGIDLTYCFNFGIVGTVEDIVPRVGQEFGGDGEYYFTLSSEALKSDESMTNAIIYVRVFIESLSDSSSSNYILSSLGANFISLYCDGNDDNNLKVEWYPDATKQTQNTRFQCPTNKWTIIAISLINNDSGSQLDVNFRIEKNQWETQYSQTSSYPAQFSGSSAVKLKIGEFLNGVINSFQLFVSDEHIQFDQNTAINCHHACKADSVCIGLTGDYLSCTECEQEKTFFEEQDGYHLGGCSPYITTFNFADTQQKLKNKGDSGDFEISCMSECGAQISNIGQEINLYDYLLLHHSDAILSNRGTIVYMSFYLKSIFTQTVYIMQGEGTSHFISVFCKSKLISLRFYFAKTSSSSSNDLRSSLKCSEGTWYSIGVSIYHDEILQSTTAKLIGYAYNNNEFTGWRYETKEGSIDGISLDLPFREETDSIINFGENMNIIFNSIQIIAHNGEQELSTSILQDCSQSCDSSSFCLGITQPKAGCSACKGTKELTSSASYLIGTCSPYDTIFDFSSDNYLCSHGDLKEFEVIQIEDLTHVPNGGLVFPGSSGNIVNISTVDLGIDGDNSIKIIIRAKVFDFSTPNKQYLLKSPDALQFMSIYCESGQLFVELFYGDTTPTANTQLIGNCPNNNIWFSVGIFLYEFELNSYQITWNLKEEDGDEITDNHSFSNKVVEFLKSETEFIQIGSQLNGIIYSVQISTQVTKYKDRISASDLSNCYSSCDPSTICLGVNQNPKGCTSCLSDYYFADITLNKAYGLGKCSDYESSINFAQETDYLQVIGDLDTFEVTVENSEEHTTNIGIYLTSSDTISIFTTDIKIGGTAAILYLRAHIESIPTSSEYLYFIKSDSESKFLNVYCFQNIIHIDWYPNGAFTTEDLSLACYENAWIAIGIKISDQKLISKIKWGGYEWANNTYTSENSVQFFEDSTYKISFGDNNDGIYFNSIQFVTNALNTDLDATVLMSCDESCEHDSCINIDPSVKTCIGCKENFVLDQLVSGIQIGECLSYFDAKLNLAASTEDYLQSIGYYDFNLEIDGTPSHIENLGVYLEDPVQDTIKVKSSDIGLAGKAASFYLRAFAKSYSSSPSYFLKSDEDSFFADIYCEDNLIYINWYGSGSVVTITDLHLNCPLKKWFIIGISILLQDSKNQIEINIIDQDDFIVQSSIKYSAASLSEFVESESTYIYFGKNFNGIINSVEFRTMGENIDSSYFKKIEINDLLECDSSCREDTLCIGIQPTSYGCTACSSNLLRETETGTLLGKCTLESLTTSFELGVSGEQQRSNLGTSGSLYSLEISEGGELEDAIEGIGQEFNGDSANYFRLPSDALQIDQGASSFIIYLSGYPTSFSEGDNKILESDTDLNFLDIFCKKTATDNKLTFTWYPTDGQKSVDYQTDYACELEKWFSLGVSLTNIEDSGNLVGKLNIAYIVQGYPSWKYPSKIGTNKIKSFPKSERYINIGKSFAGIIYSFELISHLGTTTMNVQSKFSCDESCNEDTFCIMNSSETCLSCDSGYFLEMIQDEYNIGECSVCHIFCKTCTGPLSEDCTECNSSIENIEEKSSGCDCKIGYYQTEEDPISCAACHPLCSACTGPENSQCSHCVSDSLIIKDGTTCKCITNYEYDELNQNCKAIGGQGSDEEKEKEKEEEEEEKEDMFPFWIIIVVVALVILIVVLLIFICCKKKEKHETEEILTEDDRKAKYLQEEMNQNKGVPIENLTPGTVQVFKYDKSESDEASQKQLKVPLQQANINRKESNAESERIKTEISLSFCMAPSAPDFHLVKAPVQSNFKNPENDHEDQFINEEFQTQKEEESQRSFLITDESPTKNPEIISNPTKFINEIQTKNDDVKLAKEFEDSMSTEKRHKSLGSNQSIIEEKDEKETKTEGLNNSDINIEVASENEKNQDEQMNP